MTYIFKDIDSDSDIALSRNARGKRSISRSIYQNFVKRLMDVVLVVMSGPLSVLLIAVGAMLTMLDGHRPFYSQKRIGRSGREFRIWKLRTMVPNADEKLEAYLLANPMARVEWDEHQKLASDPRITRIGAVLRKTSLDELPQLWNVLLGDMSIVGPRPMMVEQRSLYPGEAYYEHRPGITGLWQVSDRHATSFRDRARYDADYHRRISLQTDLSIIWQTIAVVMRGTGA